jgi:hypothetical protein
MSRIEDQEFCFGGECGEPVREFGDYCDACQAERDGSMREAMGSWEHEEDGEDDLTELSDPRTWGYWEDRIK